MEKLKIDMLRLIKLSAEIAKYEEMLMRCINTKDIMYFDLTKAETIQIKLADMRTEFWNLKEKWF